MASDGGRKALAEYLKQIGETHKNNMKKNGARTVCGSSVIRVFKEGTKEKLMNRLIRVPIDDLRKIKTQLEFDNFFEKQLKILSKVIQMNKVNKKVSRGAILWGHSAKVLSLYLRGMVLHSRYFEKNIVDRIEKWLFVPVDGMVLKALDDLGVPVPGRRIKDISSEDEFNDIQNRIQEATTAKIPRIWFDDVWVLDRK